MDCLWLTTMGGGFEVVGLGFVAWEVGRLQRAEFGTPRFIQRIVATVRRLRGKAHVVQLRSSTSVESAFRVRASRRKRPADDSLEERLAAVKANFGYLEGELDERMREHEGRFDEVDRRMREIRAEWDEQQRQRDEQRRASLRRTITLQSTGTVLFLVGAVLSVVGNAVTC